MNYPVWVLDVFGGGTLIAFIAVVHVYVAHFAVGGGLFLVITEAKGLRENSPEILEYTKRHARFFLLLTMVFGGLTGVAIWFVISLLSPGATSSLIHIFVFAWAIEWVFFLGEIVALLLYYYNFNKISAKSHLLLGWIYFGCAWMSLFTINGVIDFMLTPGEWLNDGNFWTGFFNPSFWPALFFRTFLALMIAGLFGLFTSVRLKDEVLRQRMVRYCGLWLMAPLLLLLGSAFWYKAVLPLAQQEMIFSTSPELKPFLLAFAYLSPILFGGGLLIAWLRPQAVRRPMAWFLLLLGLFYIGSFEFIREGGRRPYIIRDYMYSNGILLEDLKVVQEKGVLVSGRWVENRVISPGNRMEAGRELNVILCLPCHSSGGVLNNILPLARRFTPDGMASYIMGMGRANPYMPPFAGTAKEAVVLAEYLTTRLVPGLPPTPPSIVPSAVSVPEFAPQSAGYVLLGGAVLGTTLYSDPEKSGIDMSYGAPVLRAQLIARDLSPELVMDGVTLRYGMVTEAGPLEGVMEARDGYFEAKLSGIPSPPGAYQPFLVVKFTAEVAGRQVADTKARIGVATEIGCRNCHGGPWRTQGRSGLSRETAAAILRSHDELSNTDLSGDLARGEIVVCSSCHGDGSRGTKGRADLLSLSAAIHGYHAGFMSEDTGESCGLCHASSVTGASRSFDGIHRQVQLTCRNCHGTLADHAAGLLLGEGDKGQAQRMLKFLKGRTEVDLSQMVARVPWEMEPDCLNCHKEFGPPVSDTTSNRWTADASELFGNRKGEAEVLLCTSCHGPAHALYPATSPYGAEIGTLQPLQYQKSPYPIAADRGCAVCHTVEMEEEMHHPGSSAMFRNKK